MVDDDSRRGELEAACRQALAADDQAAARQRRRAAVLAAVAATSAAPALPPSAAPTAANQPFWRLGGAVSSRSWPAPSLAALAACMGLVAVLVTHEPTPAPDDRPAPAAPDAPPPPPMATPASPANRESAVVAPAAVPAAQAPAGDVRRLPRAAKPAADAAPRSAAPEPAAAAPAETAETAARAEPSAPVEVVLPPSADAAVEAHAVEPTQRSRPSPLREQDVAATAPVAPAAATAATAPVAKLSRAGPSARASFADAVPLSGQRAPSLSLPLPLPLTTPLTPPRAAELGRMDLLLQSLQQGQAVDTTDADGRTALHHAVLRQDLAMLRTLLARGANRHATDRLGVSPQTLAESRGDALVLQVLSAAP